MNARATSTEIQDLITDKSVVTRLSRKVNAATAARQRNGRGKTLKGAALKAAVASTQDDDTFLKGFIAEQEAEAALPTPEGNPGVFAAITGTLTAEQAEHAEETAIAAIARAKAPKAAQRAPAKPADDTLYSVGEYKGRAGAMFAFMSRVGDLGDAFKRETVVASIVAAPCDPKVGNRAQALDYFAWAYRHGLLIVAPAGSVEASATPVKPAKARKGRKAAK